VLPIAAFPPTAFRVPGERIAKLVGVFDTNLAFDATNYPLAVSSLAATNSRA
jgi:hypothetical protein